MLKIKNISFSYYQSKIIEDLNFTIGKGKNVSIIGESGCGKSTLLQLIYGLYDLDEGEISWNDIKILGPKFNLIPGMDFIKYLAQDFDLMPFISVAENVGKYVSNINPDDKNKRILELLELVEMSDFANVKAKLLSGGQMQRVAIARVLALEPEIVLLDEPFSHIDNFKKNSLRRKLFDYLKEKQITCIVATHDSTDVLSFADEVLVLKKGEIVESGNPKTIYNNTINYYVASLFGDVNEILIDSKIKLVYPHQLKIVSNSNFQVVVIRNYFRGNYYLIEATYNNIILYFESEHYIKITTQVSLMINK